MKGRIVWVGKTQGQQDAIVRNGRYTTVVRFKDQSEAEWLKEAWSLDLTELIPEGNNIMNATVEFLSPSAPIERLRIGSAFQLYEGPRCVAEGEITS